MALGANISPTDRTLSLQKNATQISTDTMRGAFIKKHGYHRCARMGLFTDCLLLLRCLPLGFDAPSAQRIATDFFACGRCAAERKICGNPRDLWATTKRTMAKEQAGCIYSPTDLSDKHRCHAGCLSITQIAPSARQIDTDFSHAENLSMRARFNGYAPRGQKFIAQGKRSDALGIMCRGICTL